MIVFACVVSVKGSRVVGGVATRLLLFFPHLEVS